MDWSEWNGRFRDTVRRFVKGDGGQLRDLGFRLTGSADLYADDGRSAYNSVNFVTCHDGFTLRDLVSYNRKHNEANLEGTGTGRTTTTPGTAARKGDGRPGDRARCGGGWRRTTPACCSSPPGPR